MAHRRLSIIDLSSAGHQPMSDPGERYWIVHNGEVYNFLELREELLREGCVFQSKTDTEVILHAFLRWGPGCLCRFNGMWAFAIFDQQEASLFCARDRYGVKPFYYSFEPCRFAFASEEKQLVKLPWVGAASNHRVLADFFLWGMESHINETFFAGVKSLPASHYLILTSEDVRLGRVQPVRYWHPEARHFDNERSSIEEFHDLFTDAVRLRLRSDVPVGFTLSGGLDSSSVVCCAAACRQASNGNSTLTAFNVEFDDAGYSERPFAEAAASKAKARITICRPDPDDLARDWEKFVWHMEQPSIDLSYFANFQINRLIREQGINVVLSGQGGDELLLGYERYRTYDTLFKLRRLHLASAAAEIIKARRRANMPLSLQLRYGFYFSFPSLRAARRRRLVRPILNEGFFRAHKGETTHLRAGMTPRDRVTLQQSEFFHYQLPHLLRHDDRVSMAHSVETRLPFLDYRLLELVLGQPTKLLFRDGWSKYLLRRAMTGILPEEIQWRTDKMGYETPTGRLIRQNRKIFLPLLARNRGDKVLNVPAIESRFDREDFDERLLCSAVSYLAWREVFAVS